MEKTYLQPGMVIVHQLDPEEQFRVLRVHEHYGMTWVEIVKAKHCLLLPLKEVQDKFELASTAADAEAADG